MANFSKSTGVQRPIIEQIDELKAKVALLEGDRKAYYESSFQALQQCKKRVIELREENKELRKLLHIRLGADEQIINQAFQKRPVERVVLNGKTGVEALVRMDHLVCDTMKKLNGLRHITGLKRTRLADLQTQFESLKNIVTDCEQVRTGLNETGQRIRDLENRLDKAILKTNEAVHIRKTYQKINEKLEEEHLGFGRTLDAMEVEVKRCRLELKELKEICKEAEFSRHVAQNELKRHEELVYAERKRRDMELTSLKKEVEDKRIATEKIDKKLGEEDIMDFENNQMDSDAKSPQDEESLEKMKFYETIFHQIREVTGVSDLAQVTQRFDNQVKTKVQLEALKNKTEERFLELKQQKIELQSQLEEKKFCGEENISKMESEMNNSDKTLKQEEKNVEILDREISKTTENIVKLQSAIDHLFGKTTSLVGHSKSLAIIPSLRILEMQPEKIFQTFQKLKERCEKLMNRLKVYDLLRESLKMSQKEGEKLFIPSEFFFNMETKQNQHNTRVKIVKTQSKDSMYDEEEESSDDMGEIQTRMSLKKMSQSLVDQKKKNNKLKKKKKK